MKVEENNVQEQAQKQYPGLKNLKKLLGNWKVSGSEIEGMVTYEWLEGGFFLVQHFNLKHHGNIIKGVEIIGYERGFGTESPSENIKSRAYDNVGNTFDYTYEVDDEFLIIWGGEKGSPAYYKGKWCEDGNINKGSWVYPGGGYESTMTRVK